MARMDQRDVWMEKATAQSAARCQSTRTLAVALIGLLVLRAPDIASRVSAAVAWTATIALAICFFLCFLHSKRTQQWFRAKAIGDEAAAGLLSENMDSLDRGAIAILSGAATTIGYALLMH